MNRDPYDVCTCGNYYRTHTGSYDSIPEVCLGFDLDFVALQEDS